MKNFKLFNFIKDLFNKILGKALDAFKKHAIISINVVEHLKKIVDSPTTDVITSLIPGDIDNLIVDKLRVILPVILEKTAIANNIVKTGKTQSDVIDLVLKHLKKTNVDSKKMFWISFAAELNVALADGKMTFSEGLVLTQLVYTEIKKDKKS